MPGVPVSFGQESSKKSQNFHMNLLLNAAFHTLIVHTLVLINLGHFLIECTTPD